MVNIYNIRNGKRWVKESTPISGSVKSRFGNAALRCGDFIAHKFGDALHGKTYFIPSYINYAVPVSEKQMLGNIPYGTYISLDPHAKNVLAIDWMNWENRRTDLDFHCTTPFNDYGWNGAHCGDGMTFSGDWTDATNGAAEAYRFMLREDEPLIFSVSNFNRISGAEFRFGLMEEQRYHNRVTEIESPIFPPIPLKFSNEDCPEAMTLGIVYNDKFYFYGGSLGTDIVPKRDMYRGALEAIIHRSMNQMKFAELISMCGGQVVRNEAECTSDTISLAPADLTTRTFFDILNMIDPI